MVVVEFSRNFGQHSAIFAGFDQSRGEIVVTLDADLQNPPEAIPSLVHTIESGYDVVGGWREDRQDSLFRKLASKIVNKMISWSTGVKLKDYGCMLRAYRRTSSSRSANARRFPALSRRWPTLSPARSPKSRCRTATARKGARIFAGAAHPAEF